MSFVFNVEGAPAGGQTEGKQVDWDARGKYLIEKAGTAEGPEAMIGVVSGVIDLGLQKQDPAKMEWKGDEASEVAELAKNPLQWFETLPNDKGIPTRYKRWEVKPAQQVAITVDFPDIQVNQSQWFDEVDSGEEHPLRMLVNNEFYLKGVGKVVGKPFGLKETRNDDGTWSIKNNTILFKLAQAVGGVLDEKGMLKPAYVGSYIGKAALFDVEISNTESGGKTFLNEKIKLNGQVPKAMLKMVPTLDAKYQYGVNFKGEQNLEVLKNLRQSIINTMSLATNFEGSDVQKALIQIGRVKAGTQQADKEETPQQQVPQSVPRQAQPAPQPPMDFDSFEDDIPF